MSTNGFKAFIEDFEILTENIIRKNETVLRGLYVTDKAIVDLNAVGSAYFAHGDSHGLATTLQEIQTKLNVMRQQLSIMAEDERKYFIAVNELLERTKGASND